METLSSWVPKMEKLDKVCQEFCVEELISAQEVRAEEERKELELKIEVIRNSILHKMPTVTSGLRIGQEKTIEMKLDGVPEDFRGTYNKHPKSFNWVYDSGMLKVTRTR